MGVPTPLHSPSSIHAALHFPFGCYGGYLVDDFPWSRGMDVGQTDPLHMRGCFRSEPQLGRVILQHTSQENPRRHFLLIL